MERILIIEDNKTLAKLMAKKISSELNFEVDVAYKMSEAKLFLKMYKYFLTLTDLNLPDAPEGEIVDYILEKDNHVLILSANIDKDFRAKMLKKNIIDYVNKSGMNDINYIIQTIRRLHKNKNHKILLVEDSVVFRKQMQAMLENMFFKVITVAHGEEALGILSTIPDISLVLTDYHMPVIDGLELTQEIRKTYTKNDLAVIVMSGDNDEETTALFLKNGANDYIKKPFSKEEFSCRINNSIEALENIHAITNHANRDFLTGLYNRRYFFENAAKYFDEAVYNSESFAIAMINIDNFKKIRDNYGHEGSEKVINGVADILRANTNQNDIVARFGGEDFCVLVKNTTPASALSIFERLREKVQNSVTISDKAQEIRFTVSIGASLKNEDTLEETVNQADMLLYNAKLGGKNQVVHN
ncbi:MAG: diguanylate cyclase response regulator [Sulfurimonas sp. RIFOXYD12_FULL_33_39]|uniref:GGDEF domain-containing response regulator n=1 Tax=unclassified Sulfurimonas TaxID=2623549 RepID=UPI0008B404D9|nr:MULTISPECIES: response regulator [unclassified Sulfurimonas]OHE09659.1 MAG: diguanylate cyclase response regulator [Sulfurimonas sp. RIFOXYD12_FULL_33_39]OHE13833.1 MAG: diguanylate cyclase response regulator [Sulfurimonas sp. RIFOXYD2_FULL_34_21]DAB27691.1 MAG TPA: diguanylate cyclase response regulator [Sulfurimonas sp. UBA10385]